MPAQHAPTPAWPEAAGQAAGLPQAPQQYNIFSSPSGPARQDMASIYGHSQGLPGMTPMQVLTVLCKHHSRVCSVFFRKGPCELCH